MKALKTIVLCGAALVLAASCNKNNTPVTDAVVSFGSDTVLAYIEDGPNFEIPLTVTGSNITYPLTIRVTDVAAAEDSEYEYSERNVDYRLVNRDVVIESAEDTPSLIVRVINNKVEELFAEFTIESVSNGGKTGSVSNVVLYAYPQVNDVAGVYDVTGTKNDAEYSEQWAFMVASPYVGFTGMLGVVSTDDNDIWPIIGEGWREPEYDNATMMSFPLGLDNYLFVAELKKIGEVYVCPAIVYGNSLYADGTNLDMLCLDNDTIMLGIPDGAYLTYALYSVEDDSFTGYTYGGKLAISEGIITRASDNESELAAAAAPAGKNLMPLVNLETNEMEYVPYTILPSPEKKLKK